MSKIAGSVRALLLGAALVVSLSGCETLFARPCTPCGGSGRADCSDCDAGKVDCANCNTVFGCSKCGMTTKISCQKCNGVGTFQCQKCGGTGAKQAQPQ